MKPDPESAHKMLLNASQALQRGDRQTARKLAEQAAVLKPSSEEPWLFLAALANPRTSISYLEQALKINPQSQRARKGMHWAIERLRHGKDSETIYGLTSSRQLQTENTKCEEPSPASLQPAISEPKVQPQAGKKPEHKYVQSETQPNRPLLKSNTKFRRSLLFILFIAGCIALTAVFWTGIASPVRAFLQGSRLVPAVPSFLVEAIKPVFSPSPTDTFTPTPTFTSLPTETFTPTSTDTLPPTSTDTPAPTLTFTPTETFLPTNMETSHPINTPKPAVVPVGGGVRWIDVNLSKQKLYAYEGNTVVASFLVSTGVRQFPTVTGQYHIYVKYVSTLMHGDGYYLPNVPYTMYFYKGYGIHGTYWHHNFGHPMSHGCVNMYTPDAKWMFYWAPLGTLVNIHY